MKDELRNTVIAVATGLILLLAIVGLGTLVRLALGG